MSVPKQYVRSVKKWHQHLLGQSLTCQDSVEDTLHSADGILFKTLSCQTVHKGVATRKQKSTRIKAIAIDHIENDLQASDLHVCNNIEH